MKLTPITAKVQKQTKGGMIQEPLLNVGRVEGGSKSNCGCGSKPCKCGPESVAKKYSTAKQTAKQKAKQIDPNTSTRTYNAATGLNIDQDPTYNYDKREIYNANAIKKYGSLKAARESKKSPAKILGAIAGAVAPALIKGAAGALAGKLMGGNK